LRLLAGEVRRQSDESAELLLILLPGGQCVLDQVLCRAFPGLNLGRDLETVERLLHDTASAGSKTKAGSATPTSMRRRAVMSVARPCSMSATALRSFSATGVPTTSAAMRATVSELIFAAKTGSGFATLLPPLLSGKSRHLPPASLNYPAFRPVASRF